MDGDGPVSTEERVTAQLAAAQQALERAALTIGLLSARLTNVEILLKLRLSSAQLEAVTTAGPFSRAAFDTVAERVRVAVLGECAPPASTDPAA
jgi:hypothetical protein